MWRFETDLFSFPHVTDVAAYAQSVLFVTTAVVAATLFVRRGIDRLDLVAVLKSRE
jgi:putative ABC transport system permease protein